MIESFDHKTLPYLRYLDQRMYSQIVIEKTNTDAINGYGHIQTYVVFVYAGIDTCTKCDLSSLDSYDDARYHTCHRHNWRKELVKCAAGSDRTLAGALADTERSLSAFATGRGKILFEQHTMGGGDDA